MAWAALRCELLLQDINQGLLLGAWPVGRRARKQGRAAEVPRDLSQPQRGPWCEGVGAASICPSVIRLGCRLGLAGGILAAGVGGLAALRGWPAEGLLQATAPAAGRSSSFPKASGSRIGARHGQQIVKSENVRNTKF